MILAVNTIAIVLLIPVFLHLYAFYKQSPCFYILLWCLFTCLVFPGPEPLRVRLCALPVFVSETLGDSRVRVAPGKFCGTPPEGAHTQERETTRLCRKHWPDGILWVILWRVA